MTTFYAQDLSWIHDTYFSSIAENAALAILQKLHHLPTQPYQVIDLGCGSGTLAAILSQKGLQVTGIDVSEDMLNIARKNAPLAHFVKASLFDVALTPADIITAIGEPINYLNKAVTNETAVFELFSKIYEALPPKGLFVFDALTTQIDTQTVSRIIEKEGMTLFLQLSVAIDQNILERKMLFFTKNEAGYYTKSAETHYQLLFDETHLVKQLRQIGFRVNTTKHYHTLALRQGHIAFFCEK